MATHRGVTIPDEDLEMLPDLVRYLTDELGWTQTDLCDYVGYNHPSSLSAVMKGKGGVSPDIYAKLAELFEGDVPPQEKGYGKAREKLTGSEVALFEKLAGRAEAQFGIREVARALGYANQVSYRSAVRNYGPTREHLEGIRAMLTEKTTNNDKETTVTQTIEREDWLNEDEKAEVPGMLERAMNDLGWSTGDLAARLGYSGPAGLYHPLKGRSSISREKYDTLKEILAANEKPEDDNGSLFQEPEAKVTREPVAVPVAAPARAPSNGKPAIVKRLEQAQAGVDSANRIMASVLQEYANPLTEAGIKAFCTELEALSKKFERTVEALS